MAYGRGLPEATRTLRLVRDAVRWTTDRPGRLSSASEPLREASTPSNACSAICRPIRGGLRHRHPPVARPRSLLPEIIARFTRCLSARQPGPGQALCPTASMSCPRTPSSGCGTAALQLQKLDLSRRERKPIDIFFSALAMDLGEYAAGIVLSGGDGDGTLGVKAIKERGGMTLAQAADGSGPAHPTCRRAPSRPGMVDFADPRRGDGRQARRVRPLAAAARRHGRRRARAEQDGFERAAAGNLPPAAFADRPRLLGLQDAHLQSSRPAPDAGGRAGDGGGLRRAAAAGPGGGGRAVPRPPHQRDQLLPRRRRLRGTEAPGDPQAVRGPRARRTRCASGCPAAPPARRSIPSPS